jgi:hypothetical protein
VSLSEVAVLWDDAQGEGEFAAILSGDGAFELMDAGVTGAGDGAERQHGVATDSLSFAASEAGLDEDVFGFDFAEVDSGYHFDG